MCLIAITYNDFHTWTGTALLANTCRNCSVNSPMGVKKEITQVFTLSYLLGGIYGGVRTKHA